MSTPPPPPPYAAGPAQPDPRRPRPRAWWFALGGALLLGAVVAGVALVTWTLSAFLETDGSVPVDGAPHQLTVGADGDRVLWSPAGAAASCRVLDTGTGRPVALGPVSGRFARSDGDGEWVARQRFDPGSGALEVTCSGTGGPADRVQVGPAPDVGRFLGSVAATIAVPLLLGAAGMVVLLVTAVRWATGRPREPA